jgi:hypothetical protein
MARVVETFSPRRNSVVNRSSEGKMANSRGSRVFMATRRMSSDSEMLRKIRKSSTAGGNGMTIIRTMRMTATSTPRSCRRIIPVPPL